MATEDRDVFNQKLAGECDAESCCRHWRRRETRVGGAASVSQTHGRMKLRVHEKEKEREKGRGGQANE